MNFNNRDLKKALHISSIGSFNPRQTSPLIIQIKKLNNNEYYGVLLICKNWEKYDSFKTYIKNNDFINTFSIQEVFNA